jgi:hypothetical protein
MKRPTRILVEAKSYERRQIANWRYREVREEEYWQATRYKIACAMRSVWYYLAQTLAAHAAASPSIALARSRMPA